jgi:arylsulfatase A-like enzyme
VNSAWDTHYWHYPRLTEQLLPGFDLAYSALIDDLEVRGLLDETLVICTTEHGRTPKLDADGDHPSGAGHGGRNHWSRAYSTVLAGAGIRRGATFGKTDRIAGDVTENPVSPKDVLATTYHLAGIDPHATINDRIGQPRPVGGDGRVLDEILT